MEQKKIGSFIAQQRKEKQMTQKQLGEALGVSDKTVSKWECGNGLPDISIIMPLCNLLEINVNELLSGESLTQEEYPGKAEENIMNLIKDSEETKKRNIKDIIIGITWIVATVAFIISLPAQTGGIHIGWYFDLYGIAAMVFLLAVSLHISDALKDFGCAFVFLFHNDKDTAKLENAVSAIDIAEKILLASGIFLSLFYLVMLLWTGATEELNIITINIAVLLDTTLYGILGVMVLIPVKGRLKKIIRNIQ